MIDNKILKKDIEDKQDKAIWHYFDKKVKNYMKQDREAGREFKDDYECGKYINISWLENCINKCCGGCGNDFTLDIDDSLNVTSDITAQRIDNSLHHTFR